MKITEIVVSRSVTIKTRDYENTSQFVSMKAEIDPDFGDDSAQVYRELVRSVNSAILNYAMQVHKARGKKVTKEEVGKRHGIPIK